MPKTVVERIVQNWSKISQLKCEYNDSNKKYYYFFLNRTNCVSYVHKWNFFCTNGEIVLNKNVWHHYCRNLMFNIICLDL